MTSGSTRLAACCSLLLLLWGCDIGQPPRENAQPPTPVPTAGTRLRVTNSGPSPAKSLTVLFPDSRIPFGDVAVGMTTTYELAPNGVFRYGAYQLEIDGEVVSQPVIDWVGEHPIDGTAFTYIIDVDPTRSRYQWVRLVRVTRDE